ncbi:30S ribosomal protein S31, chloroplastic [Impatiens glandulifera]|uniref:30S ribosomal protein S31, chloroplastic n=1 Tax=Impatiens glandulifera TaxID=253017 RepID=UPI001FB0DBA3|nr:30S ribosomal protein S31, chloroplastic [Impatiens glandulifera]
MASLIIGAVPMVSHIKPFSLNLSFSRSQTLASLNLTSSTSSSMSTSISSVSSPTLPLIYCGRGDRKTAKGKRFSHSFGNARPRNKKKGRGPPRISVPPSPPRKDRFEDGEKVKIEINESLFSS